MSNNTPPGDSLTHRLGKLRSAAEAIERLAADYHAALRPMREALKAVADAPLVDRDRWACAVSALARRLTENGMADVPASLEGVERWDRQFDAGNPGRAFAGRAFCNALAAAVAEGSPPAGFFAALDQHTFITTPAATREVCAALSHLMYIHTERAAPRFTRDYGALLTEVGIDGETLRHRLGQCGMSLSGEAAAAIRDWDECSSGIPFYHVDIRPGAESTGATNGTERGEGEAQPAVPTTRTSRMLLSLLDMPAVRAAVSDLYRILEHPSPTNETARRVYLWAYRRTTLGEQNPDTACAPGLIQAGVEWVLFHFGEHTGSHCPEITDSQLDLNTKAALLELRGELISPFASHFLANDAGARVQFLVFLADVVARITPPIAATAPTTGKPECEGENPRADSVELVRRFRCYNCQPPHEFSSEVRACPQCGANARNPREQEFIVPLVTIHFDPPHAMIRGEGQRVMACTGKDFVEAGTVASGETAVVTCPACQDTEVFKATKSEQHPADATERGRKSVDDLVSKLYVDRPRDLDSELAEAFSAVATGIRECTRLMASVPNLWTDEGEYRRLAACVADAATAARTAYMAVDIRLRRAGGANPMYEALNDVLTVQERAPLDPTATPGGLNAILTTLYARRAELFPRVDGKGCIDRMLDQLARVPSTTNTAPAAADPPPTVLTAPHNEAKQDEGEKPKPDDKSDGPFDADGFRFAGVEVRFGKAGKQYSLVMALWDAKKNRPAPPRPIDDVIEDVWGDENETAESTFRQLCADTRRRFQAAICPLDIQQMNGKVQLSRL